MDELSQKWNDLSDIAQASITELLAGKHQGNVMSSLMENFNIAQKALETSVKSSGSALREHEKYQESLEFRINSLKASWQSLSQSFMNSDFIKLGINLITKFVDVIDGLINKFGVLGAAAGGFGLVQVFRNSTSIDADGNAVKNITNIIDGLKTTSSEMKNVMKSSDGLREKIRNIGSVSKQGFGAVSTDLKAMAKDIAKVVVIMNVFKAVRDVYSWLSDAGKEAETTAEKFDRISDELSDVESELSGLESELSGVEKQIDALLEKDELSFADEEELARLREVSSELERQIQLAETLQESLNKSLSATSIDAFNEYAGETSFYSNKSKQERKAESSSLGSSIGNIAGLIGGAALAYFTGGISVLAGAAIGSVVGSEAGSWLGGAISNSSYDNETTVSEILDRMQLERTKLEKAQKEAYEAYTKNPTANNKEAWEESTVALSDYNTTLAEHIKQLSEYYNSIDYSTLETQAQKSEYLQMGDILDKYNIEMGTKGAKSAALDRIFSDELITEKAKDLRATIEATLNSGEEINFADFDSDKFAEIKNRLSDMGITIVDVVSYFEDLAEAQEEASNNFETYEVVSNISALSDGVTALTDAFAEFNEQGIVTAKTLTALHEVFGGLGDAWVNYVDVMTNGISTIKDAREATEQLVESYTDNLFGAGGIKFSKFNKETDKYEFDEAGYKTYLSTINQLENLGVENAKEYTDALQQQAMVRESAAQMAKDSAEKEALLAKETLTEKEKTRLSVLEAKKIDDYIFEIESSYGIRLKDSGLVQKQYDLNEYNSIIKNRENQLNSITNYVKDYENLSIQAEDAYGKYEEAKAKSEAIEDSIIQDEINRAKYNSADLPLLSGEGLLNGIDSLLGTDLFKTRHDDVNKALDDANTYLDSHKAKLATQKEKFDDLVEIAKEANIDLSDIIPNVDKFEFDPEADNAEEIFKQVYNRVESALNSSIDDYENLASEASAEIEARLNNLGLEIDFGRNFDKIVIDSAKSKIDSLNTALSEMFSGGGLSVDSIIAVDEIFGELSSYDSSKLFENTANGVRMNTEEYKRLSNEIKNVNIGALEAELDDLGDQYIETRDELNKLTYGTMEYQAKARELDGIAAQISANEELISSYKSLFSSYQEWQRAEAAGSERNMYETVLEGWESVGDEISRGWVDEGTREFLELLKGETATIIDGNGVAKEINIATASAKELKQVWKDLDDNIEHTTYSVRDFFTVDEDGNSTSQGVHNFLDAIGQMEEEKFGGLDVVRRDKDNNIIGFDFQIAGGDKAIAEALGVSEELVQIMKRAAIDAGFVVNFDGSFEDLGVLKEKAISAAKEMNEALKKDGKATIDIDVNASSVEEIQPQIDKIMESFGKRDGNGNLTGEIDMSINGSDKALGVIRTLQSMLDEVTRPAYMDIQIGQVEEDIREPLQQLQQLRLLTEQEHQLKLGGADTSKLEAEKQAIYDYFENLSPEIKAKIGLVDADGNGLTEESFNNMTAEQKIEVGYVDEDGNPIEDYSEALRKKLGDGSLSIEATVDLQIEMADSLDILAQTALFEQGLISKEEYTKRISVYLDTEVDDSSAKDEINKTINELTGNESREEVIEIIANTYGVEDVEGLKNSMSGLTDEQVMAIAQAIGKGDVDALDSAISGMDGKVVEAIANALGYDNVEDLKASINSMQGNEVPATVNTDGQKEKVSSLQSWIDGLVGTSVDVVVNFVKSGWNTVKSWFGSGDSEGGSNVNGTAHAYGTAYKQGNWRTKKTERALTGELGREIVVTPENKWYTVGDNGAEFVNIPRGSIVFNHKQTEELLKNGKATSNGGRARALVNGTAFLGGTAHRGEGEWVGTSTTSYTVGTNKVTGNKYTKSKDKDSEPSEETLDWIEVKLQRIQRAIDKLDQKASNVYKSWSSRNSALKSEITEVRKEISAQQTAYDKYMQAANAVGLSSSWAKKVRDGSISISTITDDALKEKISDYTEWYNKAIECKDAIEELKKQESELYAQRVKNAGAKYDGALGVNEYKKSMLEERISQSEAQGWLVSEKYYKAIRSNENARIKQLKNQRDAMKSELASAMKSGTIQAYSEGWYELTNQIDEVNLAIEQSNTQIKELDQTIQQLKWEQFDILQDRISSVAEEADFLIELLSSDKLYDDKGNLTNEGMSVAGLHGTNYETYMRQSELAGKEATRLKKELAKDPYDTDLEERYREMVKLHQDYILSAQNEKEAIRDLVEEGISLELDALDELIKKKNEALDAEKDLYEYQKKVEEQTKNIASLEKQLAAYAGDDSEEAAQKIQQIKVSLDEAKEDLEATEYDKWVSDTSAMLDSLAIEYESLLNQRLDNIDYLITDMTAQANNNTSTIVSTIDLATKDVGYELSTSMDLIWGKNTASTNSVLTTYGDRTNASLDAIKNNLTSIVNSLNSKANTSTPSVSEDSKYNTTGTYKNPASSGSGSSSSGSGSSSGKSYPYGKASDTTGEIGYGAQGSQVKAIQYALNKLGYGNSGTNGLDGIFGSGTKSAVMAFQRATGIAVDGIVGKNTRAKFKAKGYASGKEKLLSDELAWTQEKGRELIVRPSDGAILTPVAKGDSVLNATASGNIWSMANSPEKFIKENLNLGSSGVPNNSNSQSVYSQNIEKVVFDFPNAKNYEEILYALKTDRRFEKLVDSMTVNKMVGGSSLAKNKSIR